MSRFGIFVGCAMACAMAHAEVLCDEHLPPMPDRPTHAVLVTKFGAVPNDGRDDTAAIQQALDSLRPGDSLVFPEGQYDYASSLQLKVPEVALWGKGATLHGTNPASQALIVRADKVSVYGFTLTAETDQRRSAAETARLVVYGADSKAGFVSGTVFRGNKIQPGGGGSSSSSAGILLSRAKNFTVADNVVERTLADGIHVSGGSNNGRVINNTVKETGDDMIAVVSYLDKNQPDKTGSSSLVSNVLISNNQVDGQYWGRGISVVGGDAISIIGNTISNTTQAAAILLAHEDSYNTFGPTNILVKGNQITHVQTTKPSFLPTGVAFTTIGLRHAAHLTTGHAAIEVHSLVRDASPRSPELNRLISARNIQIIGNKIDDARADGIRIGVDTPPELMEAIRISDNVLTRIGGQPLSLASQSKPSRAVMCAGNLADKANASLIGCTSPSAIDLKRTAGASLACGLF